MPDKPINRNYCDDIIPWDKNKNCQDCVHFPQFGNKCKSHRYRGDSYSFIVIEDGHDANDCDYYEKKEDI